MFQLGSSAWAVHKGQIWLSGNLQEGSWCSGKDKDIVTSMRNLCLPFSSYSTSNSNTTFSCQLLKYPLWTRFPVCIFINGKYAFLFHINIIILNYFIMYDLVSKKKQNSFLKNIIIEKRCMWVYHTCSVDKKLRPFKQTNHFNLIKINLLRMWSVYAFFTCTRTFRPELACSLFCTKKEARWFLICF